ncbi:SRPBCC family protein [Streptosporangium sp. NPDC051022]|uniref:SRPBCC family protein n=1 Tax=Streptosporangium sp. NPDC051022 TaxID=3155752 RepID=UPI0034137410
MILDNEIAVNASPDEVFRLVSDVERIVMCLPGAEIRGRDGDAYRGGIKVKVGPITAEYAGTVRFLETDADRRHLRIQGRGADTRGHGDAEAEIRLTVDEAPGGAVLRLRTDLLIRGKLAQFGKGAIVAVSNRLLTQFARDLAALIESDRTGGPIAHGGYSADPGGDPVPAGEPGTAVRPAPRRPGPAGREAAAELDGLAMLMPPSVAKYAPVAAAFAVGVFHGWLLATVRSQARRLKEFRRG